MPSSMLTGKPTKGWSEVFPIDLPYIYRWDRQGRKGQPCAVTARGSRNSCCVRFADGYQMITSRNALKRNLPKSDANHKK